MLQIRDLTITYHSTGQKVLNGLSFNVKKGETIAILGPSGCGKTTLLSYLQGVLTPEASAGGEVSTKRSKIRTVFQEPRLLPWRNALDNVSFGLEAGGMTKEVAMARAKKALKMVGLEGAAEKLPHQLSLGMQQRVNFARAIVAIPDILLMDEPFSALDIATKTPLINEFKKIIKKKKITTLFVTHNPDEAKILADKTIHIEKGYNIIVSQPVQEARSYLEQHWESE